MSRNYEHHRRVFVGAVGANAALPWHFYYIYFFHNTSLIKFSSTVEHSFSTLLLLQLYQYNIKLLILQKHKHI